MSTTTMNTDESAPPAASTSQSQSQLLHIDPTQLPHNDPRSGIKGIKGNWSYDEERFLCLTTTKGFPEAGRRDEYNRHFPDHLRSLESVTHKYYDLRATFADGADYDARAATFASLPNPKPKSFTDPEKLKILELKRDFPVHTVAERLKMFNAWAAPEAQRKYNAYKSIERSLTTDPTTTIQTLQDKINAGG